MLGQLNTGFETTDFRSETFTKWTFNNTFSYTFADDVAAAMNIDLLMLYQTVSTGFKAGGFDLNGESLERFNEEEVVNANIRPRWSFKAHKSKDSICLRYPSLL